jgi:hypothetical protein
MDSYVAPEMVICLFLLNVSSIINCLRIRMSMQNLKSEIGLLTFLLYMYKYSTLPSFSWLRSSTGVE